MNDKEYKLQTGVLPYTAPKINIDESKKLIYDKYGNFEKIGNTSVQTDRDYIKIVIKIFAVAFALCMVFEGIRLFFAFSPLKWKSESFRPIIIGNLIKISKPDIAEKTVIMKFMNAKGCFDEMNRVKEQFSQYERTNLKYDLLFKSPEQIEKMLGEENPKGYTTPELPAISEDYDGMDMQYKYYYCYGDEGEATWLLIQFLSDFAVSVSKTVG